MTDQTCCDEFSEATRLGRRSFLRGVAAIGGTAAVATTFGTAAVSTAYAATPAKRVLVLLSMRGACDGLNLVVPHADPAYYAARPSIAVPSDRLLAKDGFFGLHPSLAPLLPWWNTRQMAAVHATGLPSANRSHFSAMEELEDADPGSSARVGWLNRLIGRDASRSPLDAVQYGGGGVPITALSGPEPALVTPDIDAVQLWGSDDAASAAKRQASMRAMWQGAGGPLGNGAAQALDVVDAFAPVRNSSATPANGASYPRYSDLGDALAATARTIRADVGAEVITVDHGSWDHHTWIGTPDNGNLQRMADEFAACLKGFLTDLGPLLSKVTIVTVSEFGRRVKENANGGLDHGYGNVMFLLGAGVKGGYYGRWPGLTNTVDADLTMTTDYRSVLTEVVSTGFSATVGQVFPGFSPTSVGVMQTVAG
ncbi:DUF1501 domain-containing protein [Nocardioides flavescens]|uniref:DUF1501 domain-containing protein n=1 Tax=Nocardioides flavescens TaxID=2691959 RepID=A0A6L7EZK5_9ACTN|nr:DUF1501 domain-containing protein [Nocardioides flavescens]MXG90015.1 DUF1501 domain-containing protein [Nocardioides flavescens]